MTEVYSTGSIPAISWPVEFGEWEGGATLQRWCQEFTVSAGCTLDSVDLYLRRVMSGLDNPGYLTVSVHSSSPTGTELYTGSVSRQTISTAASWESIPLTGSALLAVSTTYYLVVTDDTSYYDPWGDRDNIYWYGAQNSGGDSLCWYSSSTTGGWVEIANNEHPEYLDTKVYGTGLSKPTNPTPADDSGPGINFSNLTLSWVNGGMATQYTVRIGPYPLAYNVVSENQSDTSYVIPEEDISLYKDNPITWRVDASDGENTVEGDVWTFDPRPAKVTTPMPANSAANVSLNTETLSWLASTWADSYKVYPSWWGGTGPLGTVNTSVLLSDWVPTYADRFSYSESYTWHVDSVNE